MTFNEVKVGMLLASKTGTVTSLVYKKTDNVISIIDLLPEDESYLPYDSIDRSDWYHSLTWSERHVSKKEKDKKRAISAIFEFLPEKLT
jgi:hypothetical protein